MKTNNLPKNIKLRMNELKLTQKELAERAGITQVTVHKLISGKISRTSRLLELSNALQCTPEWLVGEANCLSSSNFDSNISEPIKIKGYYPLINWVQAGAFESICETSLYDAIRYPCPVKCSDSTFLLRVRGVSMSPKFVEGEIIYVDPEVDALNGRYVVARLDDENEATFKQLIIEGNQKFLKPANPSWPEQLIAINGNCTIVGVVVYVGRDQGLNL